MRLAAVTHTITAPPIACWTGPCVCMYVCTCLGLCACWSGLAQSVIQVRPTGSGLMRIGSALSGSRPGVEAVFGAQGERKGTLPKHTSSPSLETAIEMQPNAPKTLIYPGIMTQLNAPDSSEEQSDKVFWRRTHKPPKGIKALIQGSGLHSLFSASLEESVSFSLLLCVSLSIF